MGQGPDGSVYGSALTTAQLYAGLAHGCQTASLQSTPMAEQAYYLAVGFHDLGRIVEYVR